MTIRTAVHGRFLSFALTIGAAALLAGPANAQMANGKPKFVGNVTAGSVPANFSTYWNQITPENATKWGSVEGTRNSMNWSQADTAYNYAQSHGYKFKFHTLVWGAQFPQWLTNTNLTQAQQRAEIEEWIRLAGQHFPNAWAVDVVNEPIKTALPWKNALGGNGTTGWDWVITSFQLARTAFPNAKLLINEYGTENDANARNQYKTIINLLKARGLIDGIGIQSHHFNLDSMTGSQMTTTLNDYATLGLDVWISELDIIGGGSDQGQLAKYQDLFPAMWTHNSVKGITLWGYIVGQTWRDGTGLVTSGGQERPAMTWLKGYVSGSSSGGGGGPVWLEAERGTVGGNWNDNVADSTASAGQYVVAKPGQQSTASAPTTAASWVQLPFNAAAAGTYNVWFRKKTPTADDDSFWIRMDNGGWTNWNNMGSSSAWAWVKAPSTYNISAGSHTFVVGLREDGAQLDKVYLTTGSDTPSGTGGTAAN
jgi:endo-1,4-beta-xylanase